MSYHNIISMHGSIISYGDLRSNTPEGINCVHDNDNDSYHWIRATRYLYD